MFFPILTQSSSIHFEKIRFLFSLISMESCFDYILILNCSTLRNDSVYIKIQSNDKTKWISWNLLVFRNSLSPTCCLFKCMERVNWTNKVFTILCVCVWGGGGVRARWGRGGGGGSGSGSVGVLMRCKWKSLGVGWSCWCGSGCVFGFVGEWVGEFWTSDIVHTWPPS